MCTKKKIIDSFGDLRSQRKKDAGVLLDFTGLRLLRQREVMNKKGEKNIRGAVSKMNLRRATRVGRSLSRDGTRTVSVGLIRTREQPEADYEYDA